MNANPLTRPIALLQVRTVSVPVVRFNVLGFLILAAYILWPKFACMVEPSPVTFPDSAGYLSPSEHFGLRAVPAFYALLGRDLSVIVVVQSVISLLAWGALAAVVGAMVPQGRKRFLVMLLVLAMSTAPAVQPWDSIILTESLTISGFVLLIAGAMALARRWDWRVFAGVIVLLPLWAGCRDTNAYALAIIGVIVGAAVLVRRLPVHYLAIVVVCVASFAVVSRSADRGKRWLFPFYNNATQRISRDYDGMAVMRRHGFRLEWTDALVDAQKEWGSQVIANPRLAPFREWASVRGKEAMVAYLLSDLDRTALAPLRDFHLMLRGPYMAKGGGWLFPTSAIVTGVALLGVLALAWRNRSRFAASWCIPLTLIALSYPMLCITWWGDAMEIERHAVVPLLMLRLGVWLLAILAMASHQQAAETPNALVPAT